MTYILIDSPPKVTLTFDEAEWLSILEMKIQLALDSRDGVKAMELVDDAYDQTDDRLLPYVYDIDKDLERYQWGYRKTRFIRSK